VVKGRGFTLIELIIFIIIIGVIAAGSLKGMGQVLISTRPAGGISKASLLADARMEIILLKRALTGISSLSDPCASSGLAICTPLISYATANGYTVTSTLNNVAPTTTITIAVTGTDKAQLQATVSNYDAS
jgi:prepilin-type N-terminal cleavage/methylation domain-containing protein